MSEKRLLITGASGFVGTHFLEYLNKSATYEVFGTVFGSDHTVNQWLDESHQIELNLLDRQATISAVERIQPHFVVHLAALTSPARSVQDASTTYTNNISAQLHLLDGLLKVSCVEKILVIGSADEYGFVSEADNPLDEDTPLRPLNPYSVSKITQDFMALQYYLANDLPIVRLRPFNHTGERQHEAFVVSAFAKQVAQLELKGGGVIRVGNLTPIRDFSDVKDIVRAYDLTLQHGIPGDVYNIGSGTGISIQQVLDTLLLFSNAVIEVEQDPERMRPSDVPKMVADARKIMQITGWKPTLPLENTLTRVLDYWRSTF